MLVQERNRAMYVDGLQAMQAYLAMRNEQIEIPVSRVVSIADMTMHYIFSVPCADRNEYDALVYRNVGRDRRLTVITLIVLAAMLRRTEGPQARACRAVLMEDRNEDFYDGVSLYERFLESEEVVFPQEDFETDLMNEIISLRHENMQQKNTISHMQNQQPQTIINVTGDYVQNKHIEHQYEIGNVENGGIGVQFVQSSTAAQQLARPREGDYNAVREYMEKRKEVDEIFKAYCNCHTRKQVCERLSDEFGWIVDEHSLGVNLNRNR